MSYNTLKHLTTSGKQLTTTGETLYTANTGKKTEVISFILFNSHTSLVSVEIFLPATTNTASNKRYAVDLEANETLEISGKVPFVLEGGESIFCLSSVDSVVNIIIIGREEI